MLTMSEWDQELWEIECVFWLYGFHLPCDWIYNLPFINVCGRTSFLSKEVGWQTAAVCGSPCSHYSPSEELISSSTDLADAQQLPRNAYQQIQINEANKYTTAVPAVGAPSHAVWADDRTSYHTWKLQHIERRSVVSRAATINESEDPTRTEIIIYDAPTGGATMNDQSLINARGVP